MYRRESPSLDAVIAVEGLAPPEVNLVRVNIPHRSSREFFHSTRDVHREPESDVQGNTTKLKDLVRESRRSDSSEQNSTRMIERLIRAIERPGEA